MADVVFRPDNSKVGLFWGRGFCVSTRRAKISAVPEAEMEDAPQGSGRQAKG